MIASSVCHCNTLTRLKALNTFKENSTVKQDQAEGRSLSHGRLLIGQNSLQKVKATKATRSHQDLDQDYQADMGM